MTDFNSTDTSEAMQRAFAPFVALNETASHHLQTFWKNQDKILHSMNELTQDWFERRHKATETALKAVGNIGDAKAPVDMLNECQTWVMGSVERVIADGVACQKHLMNVTEALVAHLPLEAAKAGMAPTQVKQNTPRRAEAA
jgi:hypothetical protein